MAKRQIITQKELNRIQYYWNQVGGFGGELNSGCSYRSSTSNGRVGLIEVPDFDGNYAVIEFYQDSTIDDIRECVQKRGLPWRI